MQTYHAPHPAPWRSAAPAHPRYPVPSLRYRPAVRHLPYEEAEVSAVLSVLPVLKPLLLRIQQLSFPRFHPLPFQMLQGCQHHYFRNCQSQRRHFLSFLPLLSFLLLSLQCFRLIPDMQSAPTSPRPQVRSVTLIFSLYFFLPFVIVVSNC